MDKLTQKTTHDKTMKANKFDIDAYNHSLDKIAAAVMPADWDGHARIEAYESEDN